MMKMKNVVPVVGLLVLTGSLAWGAASPETAAAYRTYIARVAASPSNDVDICTFATRRSEQKLIEYVTYGRAFEQACWSSWVRNGRRYDDFLAWKGAVHETLGWASILMTAHEARTGRSYSQPLGMAEACFELSDSLFELVGLR